MASPGVIISTKFVVSSSTGFSSYLNYMKRTEAVRTQTYSQYNFAFDDVKKKDFEKYNQYMSNPEKTSALFNSHSNALKGKELDEVVKQFQIAENNNSLMWQHVISFDNAWLEKYGNYNQETHELDAEAVMKATRSAITELMHREGMDNAVWTGAIHYNTDNIHVHIAMVETEPSREKYFYKDKDGQPLVNPQTNEPVWEYKGKLNQKSLERVKSQVANSLTDQSEMLTELSLLSRNKLGNKETMFIRLEEDKELQEKFKTIQEQLPNDRRLWKYNNNAMKEIRPLLDDFSFTYLSKYKADDLKQFNELLDKAVTFYKESYGESRYDDYKENKLNELYANLGNGLLKSISRDTSLQKEDGAYRSWNNEKGIWEQQKSLSPRLSRRTINQLKHAFDNTYDEAHNEYEYNRMRRELELDNQSNIKY